MAVVSLETNPSIPTAPALGKQLYFFRGIMTYLNSAMKLLPQSMGNNCNLDLRISLSLAGKISRPEMNLCKSREILLNL